MKPIIGVVGRVTHTNENDAVICIWEEIEKAILRKGGLPLLLLPLTNHQEDACLASYEEHKDFQRILALCDGLLLQGGYQWYLFDEIYYQEALQKDMPILGICLGMQLMTKVDCGIRGMEDDNTEENKSIINHHQIGQKYVHTVEVQEHSLLQKIVQTNCIPVNSRHHSHAVAVKHLTISGKSEDGLIEAVEDSTKTFVLGVQWHPESLLDEDVSANLLFESFISAAKKYAQKKNLALDSSKKRP